MSSALNLLILRHNGADIVGIAGDGDWWSSRPPAKLRTRYLVPGIYLCVEILY